MSINNPESKPPDIPRQQIEPVRFSFSSYTGLRVTVLGLGLFSGGVATARFFARHGAQVTVTDRKPAEKLQPSIDALAGLPIRFVLGEHREGDMLAADLLVVGPAVQDDSPYFRLALAHGIPVTTEMNIFFDRCPAPIVGVTGSNGKTTTTSLIAAFCRARDARSVVGGNIGHSLLDEIDAISPDTTVVLELSSFQLHRLAWIGRSPHVAVVTNLSPNHLDWHGTYEAYTEAKRQIVRFQTAADTAVLNADDPELRRWADDSAGRVLWFGLDAQIREGAAVYNGAIVFRDGMREHSICPVDTIRIPGRHNLANTLAAVAGACACGIEPAALAPVLAEFRGVVHRLERVRELDGVRYYNDSASTTPESAVTALRAFDDPVVLIAGGYDKGMPFDAMAAEAMRRARAVVLIGVAAETIEKALAASGGPLPVVAHAATLKEAVRRSQQLACPGDTVVLSPGCASYDMFVNFEDRGQQFKTEVEGLVSARERI
ncbi:MAG: UDP-N-acetylmuramoyl-L-alanine--D-glutamate ligase [candidate division Zixibacteria bacterium]|nr:UDP-N-acetylmuramoyl-L-alanine--D-glutamate ligase [candidate division Zixibacteria bacterium]